MKNDEMKPFRFLKLQTGKRRFAAITNHLKKNGVVYLCTAYRATKLQAKHIDLITMDKYGSVYIRAGKRRDCIDLCGIRFV